MVYFGHFLMTNLVDVENFLSPKYQVLFNLNVYQEILYRHLSSTLLDH